MRHSIILFAALLVSSVAWGQNSTPSTIPSTSQPSTPDKDMEGMPHHDMSNMKDMPMSSDKEDSGAGAHVMHSMEGHSGRIYSHYLLGSPNGRREIWFATNMRDE